MLAAPTAANAVNAGGGNAGGNAAASTGGKDTCKIEKLVKE